MDQHIDTRAMRVGSDDLGEALDIAWPEWVMSAGLRAALVAILDDGSLSELARIGDECSPREASSIWSDSTWSELIETVRGEGPKPHIDATGRMLLPLTSGPILYGALELQSRGRLRMDAATMGRINDSLSPVLADLLTP